MVRFLLSSGFMLMTLSAFFYALTDVVIKFVSPTVTATEIAFFRFSIGLAILVPLMVPKGISFKVNRPWILLARGFSGTFAFLFLLKSIALIPLANAMVLFYTFPVFATFFSFLLFREPVRTGEIVLIATGMVGIYILMEPGSHPYNRGDIFALLGGCFAGFTVVLIRKLRESHGPLIIYLYFCLVGGILSFPLFLKEFTMPSLEQFVVLIVLGVLFLAAQLFMNQGFKFCKASEGSVIMMSELVFVGIAGAFIFKEALSTGFFAGALLILGSGVGLNLIHRRSRLSEVVRKR